MKNKKWITGLLIASLAFIPLQRSKAVVAQCIVGLVVIGVGVVVYMGLKKMCDHLPPCDNPPQPPAPPVTNAPPKKVTGTAPLIQVSDSGVEAYDISGASYFAQTDPYGNPYTRLFRGSLSTSTNLVTWDRSLKFVGWMSYRYTIMVWYSNTVPILTNGTDMVSGNMTNGIDFPIDTGPRMFFRTEAF